MHALIYFCDWCTLIMMRLLAAACLCSVCASVFRKNRKKREVLNYHGSAIAVSPYRHSTPYLLPKGGVKNFFKAEPKTENKKSPRNPDNKVQKRMSRMHTVSPKWMASRPRSPTG